MLANPSLPQRQPGKFPPAPGKWNVAIRICRFFAVDNSCSEGEPPEPTQARIPSGFPYRAESTTRTRDHQLSKAGDLCGYERSWPHRFISLAVSDSSLVELWGSWRLQTPLHWHRALIECSSKSASPTQVPHESRSNFRVGFPEATVSQRRDSPGRPPRCTLL